MSSSSNNEQINMFIRFFYNFQGSLLLYSKLIIIDQIAHLYEQVHKADFVILCIGKYSGFPNIPEFPPGKGPEVFNGRVMHSMDYSNLDNETAAEFIKRKKITIIGSQKSGLDLAAECANVNGENYFLHKIQKDLFGFPASLPSY